jgi:hypothetical protein
MSNQYRRLIIEAISRVNHLQDNNGEYLFTIFDTDLDSRQVEDMYSRLKELKDQLSAEDLITLHNDPSIIRCGDLFNDAPWGSLQEFEAVALLLQAWTIAVQKHESSKSTQGVKGFTYAVENTFFPTDISDALKAQIWTNQEFNTAIKNWYGANGDTKLILYRTILDWVQEQVEAEKGPSYPLGEEVNCCLDSKSADVEESTYTSVIGW